MPGGNISGQPSAGTNHSGKIDVALLDLPRLNLTELPASAEHAHSHPAKQGLAALSLPEHQRWRRNLNSGQGHQACGWIFDADTVFDTIGVLEWARLAPVDRVKGIMRTPTAWCASTVRVKISLLKRRMLRPG